MAAAYNADILASHDYDLNRVICLRKSQISYGSEFRDSGILEPLLKYHPLWPRLRDILDNGARFPLEPMRDADRISDLEFHRNRGNHKSLGKDEDFIDPVISEDIERGFALPLPMEILNKIPQASIAPLGCHRQTTINALGEIIPKYRLTHDQSFPGPSGLSVNLRVKKDLLPPILYSFVLSRLIHYIVNTRRVLPETRIFLCKIDLDAAIRRCSMASDTSYESLTLYGGLLLVALRLLSVGLHVRTYGA